MKVAVSSRGESLDDAVDPRFGRAPWLLIVETSDLSFQAMENKNVDLTGGAGIQTAQQVVACNVEAVLTGNCGPNAFRTLDAAGVKVVTGVSGSVREAIAEFKAGTLTIAGEASVPGHFGTEDAAQRGVPPQKGAGLLGGRGGGGRGPGMGGGGRGPGGGRGMFGGRGMGGAGGLGRSGGHGKRGGGGGRGGR